MAENIKQQASKQNTGQKPWWVAPEVGCPGSRPCKQVPSLASPPLHCRFNLTVQVPWPLRPHPQKATIPGLPDLRGGSGE